MSQTWIFYTIVSGLGSVGFNYISRKVLRDSRDSTAYSWWFEFFRLLIFFPFAISSFGSVLNLRNMLLFLLVGFGEFFAIYYYMKMHSKAELSVSSLVMQLRLILVPLIAFMFLNEKLDFGSYVGIAVILTGQIVALTEGINVSKHLLNPAVKYSLIAVFIVSANNVVFKYVSDVFTPQLISVAMALPSTILFPLLMKNGRNRLPDLGRKKGKVILLASVFNAVTMLFLLLALKVGPVSQIAPLHQSILFIQVILGIVFLDEKENLVRKLAGAVFVLIGVILLII